MWILIVSLIFLGFISWLATKYNWFHSSETTSQKKPEDTDEICCGAHEICEKDSLLSIESKAVYYDDEELDIYQGKPADSYDDTEIKIFESVFYTLKPEDVAGWLRSLRLRKIELPSEIRDEALLIVSERRSEVQ